MSIEMIFEEIQKGSISHLEVMRTVNNSEVVAEELAKQLEYLINCQKSDDSNVRNLSRELSLKVMRRMSEEELAKQLEYLINCQTSGDSNVRNLIFLYNEDANFCLGKVFF